MQIGVETSRAVENKRIFVVDDDGITRAVLQFMLQDDNETHDVPTLDEAYLKGRPDLLLLGASVLAAAEPGLPAKLAARWPDTRIMLIAATYDDTTVPTGVHGVLTRPFTLESVRKKVDVQLGRAVSSLVQLQLVASPAR